MKPIYKSYLLAATLLMAGACSDSNKYEPAPSEGETMGVYFEELANYDILVLDENDHIVTVKASRLNSEEAASVPLKALAVPEGVSFPSTIEFEAGEESATFDINLSQMPLSTKGELVLEIDPDYATLYGAGTSTIDLNITVSKGWILLSDNVVINQSDEYNTYVFPDQTTTMYKLDGVNRFKIDNFLNSGLEFVFTLPQTWKTYSYIVPTTNCVLYKDLYTSDDYNSWYFYDTANAEYPEWSMDGSNLVVSDLSIDSYEDGNEDNPESYIGMNVGYGLLTTYIEFTNGKGAWHYIVLNFDVKFDPFATEEE